MYNITNSGIHIKTRNFEKSAKFYKNLGLQKVFEYGPGYEVAEDYYGMVFDTGFGRIEIADGHRAVKPQVFKENIQSSKTSLMINVDKISEVIKIIKKNGIPIAVGPRHYYWGTLEVVIKDPDGLVLAFVAPYTLIEAKKIKADESFAKRPTS